MKDFEHIKIEIDSLQSNKQKHKDQYNHDNENLEPETLYSYNLSHHSHGDHVHFNLRKKSDHNHNGHSHDNKHSQDHPEHGEHCEPCGDGNITTKNQIGKNDEGCPCCAAAIDLDEVVTAIAEIKNSTEINSKTDATNPKTNTGNTNNTNNVSGDSPYGHLADFSSGAHWGIFLGISAPLALVGLTAATRNVKGSWSNRKKLGEAVKGLELDIKKYKEQQDSETNANNKEKLSGVIQRLEAFKDTLKYSKFDANFNLMVPGVINGAASTIVLSSAIVSSPWALPVIALYAGCQTMRNGYDLWRTWNRILPEDVRKEIQMDMKVGIRKINQITDSKRKFYAANTAGFAVFAVGAGLTLAGAISGLGAPLMAPGLALMLAGGIATAITNNIWTNQFKPRNGDLGVDRMELDLESITQEIGERREIKKVLKNYRDTHLPNMMAKRFGYSLLSSMPFGDKKGAEMLHKVNQSRISEATSSDLDRLDLLERMISAKILLKKADNSQDSDSVLKKILALEKFPKSEREEFGLVNIDKNQPLCEKIFIACRDLEIDTMVLDRFIKNTIIKSSDEHDKSIKNKEAYFKRLTNSGLFQINGEEIIFNIKALEKNESLKKSFMNSLEECLLFDYVEKLKYEQYGLNDFYWALDKQNKKQPQAAININITHQHKQSNQDNNNSCVDEEVHKYKEEVHKHQIHYKTHSHHRDQDDPDCKEKPRISIQNGSSTANTIKKLPTSMRPVTSQNLIKNGIDNKRSAGL